MARDYWFAFGSQPSTNTGLAPTFITFVNSAGQTIAPPSITETYVGTGLYKATYDATQTIAFVLDGATSGLVTADRYIFGVFDPADQFAPTLSAMNATLGAMGSTLAGMGNTLGAMGVTLIAQGATIVNTGNNVSAIGSTLIAQGATVVAIGNTLAGLGISMGGFLALVGDNSSTFGSTSSDPTTIFGFLKRAQEFWEGDQVYTKASGVLEFFSRGSGTSTMLRSKTVSDTTTTTTKS